MRCPTASGSCASRAPNGDGGGILPIHHSEPFTILMAFKHATILILDATAPAVIDLQDVEHASLGEVFLNEPEAYPGHL